MLLYKLMHLKIWASKRLVLPNCEILTPCSLLLLSIINTPERNAYSKVSYETVHNLMVVRNKIYLHLDYNYALYKTATQKTTNRADSAYKAGNAVDGNLATRSSTTIYPSFDENNDQWWKLDLGTRILFTEVTVYVRDGTCTNPESHDCCEYSTKLCFCFNLMQLLILTFFDSFC